MPSMMRRLTSAPKPSLAGLLVQREQVAVAVRGGRSARRRSGRGWRWPRRARSRSRRRSRGRRAAARPPPRSPPSSSMRSRVASKTARTPGSTPSPVSSGGTPKRRPSSRSALGSRTSSGKPVEVESQGSRADHVAEEQRAVGHVARERAGLVQRRGEGDHPVARDRAVGGLHPDDAAERRGLADRAARCRCRWPTARAPPPRPRPSRRSSRPAPASRPTGSSPGRSPSSRSRSPSRTRPCWSCRAASPRRASRRSTAVAV